MSTLLLANNTSPYQSLANQYSCRMPRHYRSRDSSLTQLQALASYHHDRTSFFAIGTNTMSIGDVIIEEISTYFYVHNNTVSYVRYTF
eukprot:scaffold14401_cov59-Attheya_sp.AAC.7